MPQFNIHWKGCPHHHLPRISVASPSYGKVQGRSHAHIAAQDVVRVPFGLALEKSRQQQRMRASRRSRASHGSFGLNTASRRTLGRFKRRSSNGMAKGAIGSAVPRSRKINRAPLRMSGALHMADGNQSKDNNEKGKESDSQTGQDTLQSQSPCKPPKKRKAVTPSVGPSTRTMEPRIPVRKVQRRTKSTLSRSEQLKECRRPSSRSRTSSCVVVPMRRRLGMKMSLPSSPSTVKPINKVSYLPSRTTSQQKALKVFTRELECHIVAQEAFRKAGLEKSSTTSSSMSIHTIMEFKPYSADFRAAGLAITSKEQRGQVLPKWTSARPSQMVPSLELPERGIDPETMERDWRGGYNPSRARSETADTKLRGTASTDSTVIVFESMDGASPSRESAVPYPHRLATRKTLPWLREADARAAFHSKAGDGLRKQDHDVSSSRTMTLTSMTTIIDFSPESEMGRRPDDNVSGHRATDIKWLDQEVLTKTEIPATHRQINEVTGPPSAWNNKKYGIGDLGESRSRNNRPVSTVSKTLRMGSPQLRCDHVFQGIVRNTQASTTHGKTVIQGRGPVIKTVDLATEGNKKLVKVRPETERQVPTRSPPPPPPQIASPSSTSRTNPILAPAYVSDRYEDAPWIFEKTVHQGLNGSHSSEGRSNHNKAGTRMTAARPSQRFTGDPVKRSPNSPSRTPRATTQTGGTASWSSLKSGVTSQSQTTISTEQAATSDKDVLKGLQIALAAACDENVDAWITEVSGCRVRRFLADLRVFEGLGSNALAQEAMKTAQRRRKKMEAYQARLASNPSEAMPIPCPTPGGDTGLTKETRNGPGQDAPTGMAKETSASARRTALIEEMTRRREARKAERERGTTGMKKDLEGEWRQRSSPRGT